MWRGWNDWGAKKVLVQVRCLLARFLLLQMTQALDWVPGAHVLSLHVHWREERCGEACIAVGSLSKRRSIKGGKKKENITSLTTE